MSILISHGISLSNQNISQAKLDLSQQKYTHHMSLPETPWDLGFIRTEKYLLAYLYNGASTPMTLTGVSFDINDDIEITTGGTTPVVIPPKTSHTLLFTIKLSGPTVIDSIFVFNTDKGTSTIHFYGIRAPYLEGSIAYHNASPNWKHGLTETWEWKTDLMTSYDGSETRISLRYHPRRNYSLPYIEWHSTIQELESELCGRETEYLQLPTWSDLGTTTAEHTAGDTVIFLDLIGRDYFADREVIIWTSEGPETFTIVSKDNVSLTINSGLIGTAGIGSYIAPRRPYYVPQTIAFTRPTESAIEYVLEAESVYEDKIPLDYIPDLFNGYEVCPLNRIESYESINMNVSHIWERLDNQIGHPEIVRRSSNPIYEKSFLLKLWTRPDIHILKQFLTQTRGMQVPFWFSSVEVPLKPYKPDTPLPLGADILYIEYAGYEIHRLDEPAASFLEVELMDGSLVRTTITGVVPTPVDTELERLTVSAWGDTYTTDDIKYIRYLQLVRFNSDRFEMKWTATDRLDITLPIKVLQEV